MTSYQAGDLILVDFPFAGGKQVKTWEASNPPTELKFPP
jgi:hypothetical protein